MDFAMAFRADNDDLPPHGDHDLFPSRCFLDVLQLLHMMGLSVSPFLAAVFAGVPIQSRHQF
jgi:hypothetical protein